jgi:PKHD-type hydroxylase
MYNTIFNNPWERATVTYPFVLWNNGFTKEELDNLVKYCDEQGTDIAQVFTTSTGEKQGEDKSVRRCDVKFHGRNDQTGWFFDRMNFIIKSINDQFYNFDLNGYKNFQYTSYNSSEKGEYNWHMDICMGTDTLSQDMHEPRKLSFTVLLNEPGVDFEGGDFMIALGDQSNPSMVPLQRGIVIAFPSFMVHAVKPVTKGFRKSAVIWVTGPKFR